MRRPIIHAERLGASPHIHAKCFPGEWLLENALAKIPGEKQRVGSAVGKCREETELGDADVLRFVDYGRVVSQRWPLRLCVCERLEYAGLGVESASLEAAENLFEDLPQHGPSGFWQTGAPAEAWGILIRLPRSELPGI